MSPPRNPSDLLPLIAQLADATAPRASLDDLAAADGRSKFHLQRIFRQATGESPLEFERRVRLQRAAADLSTTERKVIDIALDAGFDSHEGFSRAFRKLFGESPQGFRRSRPSRPLRHREISHRAAPCLGLYRRPTAPTTRRRGDAMSYDIERKDLPEIPFVFQRRRITQAEIPEALAEMFGAVYQFVTSRGLEFAGPPTARYPDMSPGGMTLEAGMPITEAVEGEGEVLSGSLQGGANAVTVHKGPYDQIHEAHQAMEKWIAAEGATPGGAPSELYVTDPGEVPDPAEWLTEIRWPLA